jgi:hypothetical protein
MFAGTLVAIPVTERLGHAELARPIMISIGALAIIVIIYPELYRKPWFWMVMALFTGLHLPLIFLVHWSSGWIPSAVILPFCVADLAIMIWIISFIQRRATPAPTATAQTR